MKFFASELAHYDMSDIETAVRKLMYFEREEGQTAFPDLPTLNRAIGDVKNARLRADRERREREAEEAEARDRREHPEKYFSVDEMISDFLKSKNIEILPPQKQPVSFTSEVMTAVLELFSAADLRALADIREKQEAMKRPIRTV